MHQTRNVESAALAAWAVTLPLSALMATKQAATSLRLILSMATECSGLK
jgi:hypothetical protein